MDAIFYALSQPMVLAAVAVIAGLIVGSFLNVVIYRLPLELERAWSQDMIDQLTELGHKKWARQLIDAAARHRHPRFFAARSVCPHCNTVLGMAENLPLLSFLLQRGRCRHCSQGISWRYPLVEGLTGVAFLACALQFGPTAAALAAGLFTALVIAMSFIDLDRQLLPDELTLALLWIGLLASLAGWFTDPESAILGASGGFAALWAVVTLYGKLRNREVMGRGDLKLFAAMGAWLGWQALPMVLFLAAMIGIGASAVRLCRRRDAWRNPLPFGPALAAAGLVALFFGPQLTSWLQRL